MNQTFSRQAKRRVAFALLLTTVLAPVFGALYAGPWGAVIACVAWLAAVTLPRTVGLHLLKGFYGFFEPSVLPLTLVNIVLTVVVGSIAYGMDIAFYAALIGVPIVVLTLIVVALEPVQEPVGEYATIHLETRYSPTTRLPRSNRTMPQEGPVHERT